MTLLPALFVFLFVLALAYAASRLLGRRLVRRPGGALHLRDSLPLGRDRALLLVEVQGRLLLVGATPQSVNLVSNLEGVELPAGLPAEAVPAGALPSFAAALDPLLERLPGLVQAGQTGARAVLGRSGAALRHSGAALRRSGAALRRAGVTLQATARAAAARSRPVLQAAAARSAAQAQWALRAATEKASALFAPPPDRSEPDRRRAAAALERLQRHVSEPAARQ